MTEVVLFSADRPLGKPTAGTDNRPFVRLSAIGLVVSEHVDKIGFFEPSVEIVEKEVLPDRLRFVLRRIGSSAKTLDEIVRGFKIGCFRIAREYGLVSAEDRRPIFSPGFEARELE